MSKNKYTSFSKNFVISVSSKSLINSVFDEIDVIKNVKKKILYLFLFFWGVAKSK